MKLGVCRSCMFAITLDPVWWVEEVEAFNVISDSLRLCFGKIRSQRQFGSLGYEI